jgi:hypothetical protein
MQEGFLIFVDIERTISEGFDLLKRETQLDDFRILDVGFILCLVGC